MTDSEAIRDVIARYNLYGDSGRFDELLQLFTAEATMTVEGKTYDGVAGIREVFDTAAGPSPEQVRHFTSTLVVDVVEDSATASCYFQVLTEHGLDHWGRYRDTFVRSGGRWLFARRDVRVDGRVAGGWADTRMRSTTRPAAQPGHDVP